MRFVVWSLLVLGLILPICYLIKFAIIHFDINLIIYSFLDPYIRDCIFFTLETALISLIFIFLFGISSAATLISLPTNLSRIAAVALILSVLNPPFVGSIGYRYLLSSIGLIESTQLGIALSQSINLFPLVAILFDSAFRNIDKSLLETAKIFNIPRPIILLRIILPLVTPAMVNSALFCLAGIFADIGSPIIFEERRFLSLVIFNLISDKDPFGIAVWLIIYHFILFGLLMYLCRKHLKGYFVETVSTAFKSNQINFKPAFRLLVLFLFAILFLLSHTPQLFVFYYSVTTFDGSLTLRNFYAAFTDGKFYQSIFLSSFLAFCSSMLALMISFHISWKNKKSQINFEAKMLDYISIVPQFFPVLLLAFLVVLTYKGTYLDNTSAPIILLIILYTIRKIPQGTRVLVGLLKQIGSDLEDAAKVFGFQPRSILLKIYLPILSQTFLRLFVVFFTTSLFETSSTLVIPVDQNSFPLSKFIYNIYSEPENFHPACAMLSLVLLFAYLVSFLIFKLFQK